MEAKVQIRTVLIYSMLICVVSGCEITRNDCTLDVNCVTTGFGLSTKRSYFQLDNCNSIFSDYNGYRYSPVRLKVASTNILQELYLDGIWYDRGNRNTFSNLIVALDMSNISMETAPELVEMKNLKMLNLSNNYLFSVNLFNSYELEALQNIDYSWNIITYIKVDSNKSVFKNIRTLNFSHNSLTSIPGGVFEELKYLEYLDLSNNKIAIIDHYSFEGLKSLKYLYLSYNNISNINVSLFRFNYLEELYLNNNNIERLTSENFMNLRRLRVLDLDYNKLCSIDINIFNDTETLSTLKLSHNFLSQIHKDAFLATNNLETIDLSNNLLETLPNYLFRNKNLTSFSLVGNNIRGAISTGIFEGLQYVTVLDVSFQRINEIGDFAFIGLEELNTLLLNNNEITMISNNSFNTLSHLMQLDLSNNFITKLDFNKGDFLSLKNFLVAKNYINKIFFDDFRGFNSLQFLDLSYNNITNIESNSFNSLEILERLQLNHNPISGVLLNNSFTGLKRIPVLDMSSTLLTSIQNGSFSSMVNLQDLNISRSSISNLEYNALTNTGNIEIMDLSFNNLTDFYINVNDLKKIAKIYLNNNNLVFFSFKEMSHISQIFLAYNFIQTVDSNSFASQLNLECLDLSFNYNLSFHISAINNSHSLDILILSGVKYGIVFMTKNTFPIKEFVASYSNISNVSKLHLNSMVHLTNLILSNNEIATLEYNAFSNISALKYLDLSFNNIYFIQAGTFKDNLFLCDLNLSHNLLTIINYGIFRGLMSLNNLNISYNSIRELGRERLYDTPNLKQLIVDHNKITVIDDDYFGDSLNELSIGNNPLSCEKIVSLKRRSRFHVSALNKDETNGDNIDGIKCSMNSYDPKLNTKVIHFDENVSLLEDIRNILLNLTNVNQHVATLSLNNKEMADSGLTKNMYDKREKHYIEQAKGQIQLNNSSFVLAEQVNKTNSILERILITVLGLGTTLSKPFIVNTSFANNSENDNNTLMKNDLKLATIIQNVNNVKRELLYLENAISGMNRKISYNTIVNKSLVTENSYKSDQSGQTNWGKSFVFLEICVSLILIILLSFFVYKCYREQMSVTSSRSLSTRRIAENIDDSNL